MAFQYISAAPIEPCCLIHLVHQAASRDAVEHIQWPKLTARPERVWIPFKYDGWCDAEPTIDTALEYALIISNGVRAVSYCSVKRVKVSVEGREI